MGVSALAIWQLERSRFNAPLRVCCAQLVQLQLAPVIPSDTTKAAAANLSVAPGAWGLRPAAAADAAAIDGRNTSE